MSSMGEKRSFDSAKEVSTIGVFVGTTAGTVTCVGVDGITIVETMNGTDVDVGSGERVRACFGAQAVNVKRIMSEMNFFMVIDYM